MVKITVAIIFCTLLVVSFGCASQIRPFNEYVNGWVGKPISDLVVAKQRPGSFASRIGWKDRRYVLENGNWIYVSPEREGCIVHWEINTKDIIVGCKVEGSRCNW